jgi:hypothetical protein
MSQVKSYGIDILGPNKIEELSTLPSWSSAYERRIVYAADVDTVYFGTGSRWIELQLPEDQASPGNSKYYGTNASGTKGWQNLSTLPEDIGIGGAPGSTVPSLRRCTINTSTGAITLGSGPDLMLNGTDNNSPDQEFIALKIWNSVWNDIADFHQLDDELVYGKCYIDTTTGSKICSKRCQMGVIGIASNTFGYGLGVGSNKVPIAVSGWVLAYVDKEYEVGTPLTNDKDGNLTKMSRREKRKYPERMVGIYSKKEENLFVGSDLKKIDVDGRHWIKVK